MDLLQEVALKYGDLLNKDYLIKASYKKKTIEICFFFLPEHFYHLVGFHKLLDMKDLTKPKYLYTSIISKKITTIQSKIVNFWTICMIGYKDFVELANL